MIPADGTFDGTFSFQPHFSDGGRGRNGLSVLMRLRQSAADPSPG